MSILVIPIALTAVRICVNIILANKRGSFENMAFAVLISFGSVTNRERKQPWKKL